LGGGSSTPAAATADTKTKEQETDEFEAEPADNETATTSDDRTVQEDIGIATENVKQVASKLGSYLYGFASVATNTASKLKDTAAEQFDKGILADFNRENEKFKQENETRRIGDGVPPWVGYHEEAAMKRQILALSTDERNFLRSPPSGVDFVFDVEQKMPVAMATLAQDENLEKMRFQLVPKKVTEEKFWRNYFYRVSLVKQSTQLSSMADNEMKLSHSSTESLNKTSDSMETAATTTTTADTQQEGNSSGGDEILDTDDIVEDDDEQLVGSPSAAHEFVSDSFQGNEGLSEEERIQMMGEASEDTVDETAAVDDDNNTAVTSEVVGIERSESDDWDLEKELQEEIESFELVNENTEESEHWEKEIEDLIELEDDE